MATEFGLMSDYPRLSQKPAVGAELESRSGLYRGLAGYWPMLEGAGSLTQDYTYQSPATISAAVWSPARSGSGLTCSPASSVINAGNTRALKITSSVSMSAWLYTNQAPANGVFPRIISKLQSSTFNGYEMVYAANDSGGSIVHGAVYIQLGNAGTLNGVSDTIALPLGVWNHFAVTFNSSSGLASVYRNGVMRASAFIGGGANAASTQNLNIGSHSGFGSTHRFQGIIEQAAVWNRDLSAAEVASLYSRPYVLFREERVPSRKVFAFTIGTVYEKSLNVDGVSAATIADGGTLYRTKSIDCTAAATISNTAVCYNSVTVGAVCDISYQIPILLTLSIAGISAYTVLPGQPYFTNVAIEGTSDIGRLPGSGYFKTLSVDGMSDIAMEQIGLKLLALTIDGVSDAAISSLQDGNLVLSVSGISACAISPSFTYQLVFSLTGIATVYEGSALNAGGSDGLYNFLSLTANDVTAQTVKRYTPGDQNPSAQSSVSASCTGVFNRLILQDLNLLQTASYKKPTEVQQQLVIISHAAVAQRIRNRTLTQTLSVTQDAEGFRATIQSIAFTGQAVATKVISRTVTQVLGVTQSATRNTVLARSLTHTLAMGQNRLVRAPITGIINNNSGTVPFEYYKPVAQAILVPTRCLVVLGVATELVILPCPQFNDTQSRSSTLNLKRTMTGDTYTYVRRTDLQKLKYTFQVGTYKAAELQSFLESHCHEIITLVNHKGETWYVNLVNNPFEFTVAERWQPKGERHDITLEFEGVQQ